nr:immunoglobulin heavy chain junction region [Macaca mulatta]
CARHCSGIYCPFHDAFNFW